MAPQPKRSVATAPPTGPTTGSPWRSALACLALGTLLVGCGEKPDLVVRISLDQIFSEELIRDFEAETGLKVNAQYDIEQSKTVGHVRAIIAEKNRPRTDVFWNNEVAQTIRLAELGLLAPYDSPSATEIPEAFRDPARLWTGFAARARVLIVNTDLVPAEENPNGTLDLLDPRWAGTAGIARPLTGTTLTHATALFQTMGEEWTRGFLNDVVAANGNDSLALPESNGQAMTLVKNGALKWAWTDTDDFNVARVEGAPVRRIYPDQSTDEGCLSRDGKPLGTLLIPNTIMILDGAPNPDNARVFVDWVLRKEIEERLAKSRSAQIPVRDSVPRPDHVGRLGDFAVMDVDYVELGKTIGDRTEELANTFLR